MLNTYPLNTYQLNSAPAGVGISVYTGDLSVGGLDFASEGLCVNYLKEVHGSNRNISRVSVPAGHGSIELGDYFNEKIIVISGNFKKNTREELSDSIDRVLNILGQKNIEILIKRANKLRRYKVKLMNMNNCFNFAEHYKQNFTPFTFELLCLEPFGEDVGFVSEVIGNQSNKNFPFEVVYGGSAIGWVDFVVTLNAVSGISKLELSQDDGFKIIIEDSFSTNDVIEISGENKTVKINGSEVEYGGAFHELKKGGNSFHLIATGTSLNFDLSIKHKNLYH